MHGLHPFKVLSLAYERWADYEPELGLSLDEVLEIVFTRTGVADDMPREDAILTKRGRSVIDAPVLGRIVRFTFATRDNGTREYLLRAFLLTAPDAAQ